MKLTCLILSCSDAVKDIARDLSKSLPGHAKVSNDYSRPLTHLVASSSGRTMKVLFALARNAIIVDEKWLYACLEADQWVDHKEYLSKDFNKAGRARKTNFLTGTNIFVGKENLNPSQLDLTRLITLIGKRKENNMFFCVYHQDITACLISHLPASPICRSRPGYRR